MMQHYHMRQVSTPLQWSLKKTRKTQDTRTYWEIYEKNIPTINGLPIEF